MQCHKSRVRQYHRIEATGKDDPDWSLGTFVGGQKAERIASPDAPGPSASSEDAGGFKPMRSDASSGAGRLYFTSHFFRGGQRCDENGQQRATEVQFFCCPAAVQHGERSPAYVAAFVPRFAPARQCRLLSLCFFLVHVQALTFSRLRNLRSVATQCASASIRCACLSRS